MKVYCKNCKNFHRIKHNTDEDIDCICISQYPDHTDFCHYSDNIIFEDVNNYYNSKSVKKYINTPEELNKNNNCSWYKEKVSYIPKISTDNDIINNSMHIDDIILCFAFGICIILAVIGSIISYFGG